MKANWSDVGAGLTYGAFGLLGVLLGRDLPMGNAAMMGPGYVPRMIAIGLLIVGAAMIVRGLCRTGAALPLPTVKVRIIAPIFGSIIAFALALPRLGVITATAILVSIAVFADKGPRLRDTFFLIAGLCALVYVVFIIGLDVQMRAWPW
jgi:divalent metal cation (Fe/Co/Zn/Cd) transporter